MAGPQNGISGDATVGVQVWNLVPVVEAAIQGAKEPPAVVETRGLEKGLRCEPKKRIIGCEQ